MSPHRRLESTLSNNNSNAFSTVPVIQMIISKCRKYQGKLNLQFIEKNMLECTAKCIYIMVSPIFKKPVLF